MVVSSPFFDAEFIVEDFGDGREAVGGAGSVRHDVMVRRVVFIFVDAQNDGQIFVFGGRGDHDFFHAVFAVRDRFGGVGEEAGGFDHDVRAHAVPFDVGGAALGEHGDFFAVDDEIRSLGLNVAAERAVSGVPLEEVRVGFRVR